MVGEVVYWAVLTLCVLLAGAGLAYGAVVILGGQTVRIEVYVDTQGFWRWRAVARNNRVIADGGEGYESRRNALRAARKVQASMATAAIVELDH